MSIQFEPGTQSGGQGMFVWKQLIFNRSLIQDHIVQTSFVRHDTRHGQLECAGIEKEQDQNDLQINQFKKEEERTQFDT